MCFLSAGSVPSMSCSSGPAGSGRVTGFMHALTGGGRGGEAGANCAWHLGLITRRRGVSRCGAAALSLCPCWGASAALRRPCRPVGPHQQRRRRPPSAAARSPGVELGGAVIWSVAGGRHSGAQQQQRRPESRADRPPALQPLQREARRKSEPQLPAAPPGGSTAPACPLPPAAAAAV